jgi:hypothetical protein
MSRNHVPGQLPTRGARRAEGELVLDFAVVLLVFRHWSMNRHGESPENDQAARILLWVSCVSVLLAIGLVLQQQFYVDVEMVLYSGRYFLSVIAAGSVIILFSVSTVVGKSLRAVIIACAALAIVMLLFDAWTYSLLNQFYIGTAMWI